VGCDGLSWILGLGAGDEDDMVEVLGDGCGDNPRTNESLDLEGPSFAATTPRLSKNFLNSYLPVRICQNASKEGMLEGLITSDILLEVAVPFLFNHVRRGWVPDFIGVVDRIRLDVSHLFHGLGNRT